MGAGGLLGMRQHIDAAGRAQRRELVGRASRLPEREARNSRSSNKKHKPLFGFLLSVKPLTRFLPALRYGRNHPLPFTGRGE